MKIIFCLVASMLSQLVFARTITLNEIKNLAQTNNYAVNASQMGSNQADVLENALKSNFSPKIGIEFGRESITSEDVSETETITAVYGEMNLFNGFSDNHALNKTKLNSKIAKSNLSQVKFELNLLLEKMYYQFLYLNKRLSLVNQAIKRNSKHINLIKKRLSSNLITETDLLEFKLRKSKLSSTRDFIKLRVDSTKELLFKTAGINVYKKYNISGELPHFEIISQLDEIQKGLIDSSERIYKSQLAIQKSDYDIKMAKKDWYPSVDLEVRHGNLDEAQTGVDNDEVSTSVAVLAKWELFSGMQTKNITDASRYKKLKNEYLLKQSIQDSRIGLTRSYKRLLILEKRILAEEQNEKLSQTLYRRTVKEYKKGIKDSGALSSAGDEVSEINEKIYELKVDYINTKISLEKFYGKPLSFKIVDHKDK